MRTAVYELIYRGRVVYVGRSKEPDVRLSWHRWKRPQGKAISLGNVTWYDDADAADRAERLRIIYEEPPGHYVVHRVEYEVDSRSFNCGVRDICIWLKPEDGYEPDYSSLK